MTKPPFIITPTILNLIAGIQEILGELKAISGERPSIKLRRENKIKTIKHSLAIEGNDLSEEQITALLDNKRVIGPEKQIREVINALKLYDELEKINPLNQKHLLQAHSTLMKGLVLKPGTYRSGNVGIIKGKKISHVAPQAKHVANLMQNLFSFVKANKEISFLLKACIFHYELEFIHPFEDGNGRMGRLWQLLLLMRHSSVFEYISVETLIHKRQQGYYKVLEASDKVGDSTQFVEFSLELILQALTSFQEDYRPAKSTTETRLSKARVHFVNQNFTRKDYMQLHKDISSATASRDLASAVKGKSLVMKGEKALAVYKFTRVKS